MRALAIEDTLRGIYAIW